MLKPDPRLDVLIYAHDGRGLGHVSRSIAVGSALRRLFPSFKVMLLSGSRHTGDLIGSVPLDWLKLPAYTKQVVGGKTVSRIGPTNLKNSYLVASRARLIKSVVDEYRPRCILVDHEARGKRDELLPAMTGAQDIVWILGLRGIVGRVGEVWSTQTADIFKRYYKAMLWYGDSNVLGDKGRQALEALYDTHPVPVGYVSRLLEMRHWGDKSDARWGRSLAGTIAIPWQTGRAAGLFETLHRVLSDIGPAYGRWQLFVDNGADMFSDLPFCDVHKPGPGYLDALRHSKTALVYGGYNSMTDILATGTPAVVLLRALDDQEQQEHVRRLAAAAPLIVFAENRVERVQLQSAFENQLQAEWPSSDCPNLEGAENAARRIAELLG
jgi:predicted glycosyltransferase